MVLGAVDLGFEFRSCQNWYLLLLLYIHSNNEQEQGLVGSESGYNVAGWSGMRTIVELGLIQNRHNHKLSCFRHNIGERLFTSKTRYFITKLPKVGVI